MALIGENLWYLKSIQTSASHGSAGKQNRQNLCCKCYNLLLNSLRANYIFKLLETISCYAISPLTQRYGTYFHKKEEPRMKKRLLSLLLAMAMIVSMVPFQALAEEPDATAAAAQQAHRNHITRIRLKTAAQKCKRAMHPKNASSRGFSGTARPQR